MKRVLIVLVILSICLSFTVIAGCKKQEPEREPLPAKKYTTIAAKGDNVVARQSIADTAVRYFYLICNEGYESANELIDRTDLSICTPDILQTMYKRVQNFKFTATNRVIGVDVKDSTATITFMNKSDNDRSFEPSFDEENPKPAGYGTTKPYLPNIAYANTYKLTDINKDGVINETDMMWEDHPELNPKYKPPKTSTKTSTTSTSATTVMRTSVVAVADTESEQTAEKGVSAVSEKSGAAQDVSKGSNVSSSSSVSDVADINVIQDGDLNELPIEDAADVSKQNSSVESEASQESEGSKKSKVESDGVLPDYLLEEEEVIVYKTYKIDIQVTPYASGFKVRLPESMTTNTRLMIKVPDDMRIKVGDLELNRSMMNLEDFYVIDKLPKVDKFTLQLENKILGTSEKEIDLTSRVYYIYSNIVPSHDIKDEVIAYIQPALQQYYDDVMRGVGFYDSGFFKLYSATEGEVMSMKYNFDLYQLSHAIKEGDSISYNIRKLRFPEAKDKISADLFRVTSYYYVEVPIHITVEVTEIKSGRKSLSIKEIEGVVKVTKEDGKYYVWDIDKTLALVK